MSRKLDQRELTRLALRQRDLLIQAINKALLKLENGGDELGVGFDLKSAIKEIKDGAA